MKVEEQQQKQKEGNKTTLNIKKQTNKQRRKLNN